MIRHYYVTMEYYHYNTHYNEACHNELLMVINNTHTYIYIFFSLYGLLLFLLQKNSAVAGALTGVALALTSDDTTHEQVVHCAITGAAISTAANLLSGIF